MRYVTFDLARGLAYALMVVAHVAPSDGPGRILITSEFLTAPLFALLVGAGAALSWERQRREVPQHLLRHAIRGLLVFALGWVLAQSSAQVVIVLMHLGVLMVAASLVALTPSSVVGTMMFVSGGASVLLAGTQSSSLLADGPYRPFAFLAYACAGILLARIFVANKSPRPWPLAIASATLLTLMLACLVVPNILGHGVHAYDGSLLETLGNLHGAVGIVLGCWFLAVLIGKAPWSWALAAPGQAALSLYTFQVIVLHVWTVTQQSADDHWIMLVGLIVGGFGLAIAWQASFRSLKFPHFLEGFRRGPLEGLLGCAVAPIHRSTSSSRRHEGTADQR